MAAPAVTLLGTATLNTTAGTHTVVATPAVGDLIVLVVANTTYTGTTLPTDNNADGLGTYTLVNSSVKATSADTMQVYVRDALVGSATSTTYTHAAGAGTSGGGLGVMKVTGMNRAGSSAIRQSAVQSNATAATTPTPVFTNAALTNNPIIGAVFNATSPATLTPRSSPAYAEAFDLGYATPTTGLEVMSINSGETATSIAWGGTSASTFCSIAVELAQTLTVNTSNTVTITESRTMFKDPSPITSDSVTIVEGTNTLATYYFNASDAGPTDASGVWTNDANAFDGNIATYAFGGADTAVLKAEGTNAPTSGNGVTQVRARLYGYTSGDGIGTATYSAYVTLSTPSGGWTWQKVNDLEVDIGTSDGNAFSSLQITASIYTDGHAAFLGQSFLNGVTNGSGQSGFVSWVEIEVTSNIPVNVSVDMNPNKSDSATVTDTVQGYSDTVYTVENVSVAITGGSTDLTINKSDSVTITEATSLLIPELFATTSDSSTITESVQRLVENRVSTSDTATITENLQLMGENRISVSDSPTITENILRMVENRINVSDSSTITENRTVVIPELLVSVSDTATVTEALQRLVESNIVTSDSTTITEALQRLLEVKVAVSDTATITEALALLIEVSVNKSDSITVTESSTVTIAVAGDYSVSVSDSTTISESLKLETENRINVSDSATITEALQRLAESRVNVSDSLTITEAVALMAENRVSVSDTATITENLKLETENRIVVSDSATITEAVTLLIPTLFITTSDSSTVTESTTIVIATPGTPSITVNDSATVTESVRLDLEVSVNKSDSVTITENVQTQAESYIATNDYIRAIDYVGNNLVFNGDFESMPPTNAVATSSAGRWIDGTAGGSLTSNYGWAIPTTGNTSSSAAQYDTAEFHSGSGSMRLSTLNSGGSISVSNFRTNGPTTATLPTDAFPILPNTSYTVTGWIKTNNVAALSALIDFRQFSAAAANLATTSSTKFTGTNGWTQVSFNVTTNASAAWGTILLRNNVAGNVSDAWFDDITVSLTTPSPFVAVETKANASDTATITESIGRMVESFVNKSDSITATENVVVAITATGDLAVAVTDSLTVTDTPSLLIPTLLLAVTDNLSVSESLQRVVESFVSVSDSSTITEALQRLLEGRISVSESVTVTEAVQRLVESYITTSDTATITESVSVAITGGIVTPTVSVSDTATITESVQLALSAVLLTISDNISLSEAIKLEINSFVNKSDTATITESVTARRESNISVSDSATITESVSLSESAVIIQVSDSLTVTEHVRRSSFTWTTGDEDEGTAIDVGDGSSGAVWGAGTEDEGATIPAGDEDDPIVWIPGDSI